MINQTTKDKIQALHLQYLNLSKGNESVLKEITLGLKPQLRYRYAAFKPYMLWTGYL